MHEEIQFTTELSEASPIAFTVNETSCGGLVLTKAVVENLDLTKGPVAHVMYTMCLEPGHGHDVELETLTLLYNAEIIEPEIIYVLTESLLYRGVRDTVREILATRLTDYCNELHEQENDVIDLIEALVPENVQSLAEGLTKSLPKGFKEGFASELTEAIAVLLP